MTRTNNFSIKSLCALCALLLLLAGCSSRGGGGASGAADLDPAAAAETILEQVAFRDTLVKAEGGAAESFYALDDKIESYAIYISGSGATAEEIAVLKVADSADAKAAEDIVGSRVDTLKIQFEDYVPGEMVKLNDPVIVTKGNVVVLVLADDSANAKKVVDGLFQ